MLLSSLKLDYEFYKVPMKWHDTVITINTTIPVDKKIDLVSDVLSAVATSDNNFLNEFQYQIYRAIYIIEYYTDIELEEGESILAAYEKIALSGLFDAVLELIDRNELRELDRYLRAQIRNYFTYKSSALGIMESIGTNYKKVSEEIADTQDKVTNRENLEFLDKVLTKLG